MAISTSAISAQTRTFNSVQSKHQQRLLPPFWSNLFKSAIKSSFKDDKLSVYNSAPFASDHLVRQLNSMITMLRCTGAPATESSRYSNSTECIEDEWSYNSDSDRSSSTKYWSTFDTDSSCTNDVEISDSYISASTSANYNYINDCHSHSASTCTSSPRVSFESAASSCSPATSPLIDRAPLISSDAIHRINQILIQDDEAAMLSRNEETSSCSSADNEATIAKSESDSDSVAEEFELDVFSEEDAMAAFTESVMEMVICRRVSREEDLEDLLEELIRLNPVQHHSTIAKAFLLAMEQLQMC